MWGINVFSKGKCVEKSGSKAQGQSVRRLKGSAFSPEGKLGNPDLEPTGFSRALDLISFVNLLQDRWKGP